jgi:hypothetical protein
MRFIALPLSLLDYHNLCGKYLLKKTAQSQPQNGDPRRHGIVDLLLRSIVVGGSVVGGNKWEVVRDVRLPYAHRNTSQGRAALAKNVVVSNNRQSRVKRSQIPRLDFVRGFNKIVMDQVEHLLSGARVEIPAQHHRAAE